LSMWDKEIDAYHKYLPGQPCADTKREHEKTKTNAETKDPDIHYMLKLPKNCRVDNFLCSGDYVKIDCRRFLMEKAVRGRELVTGVVTWIVAFDVGNDSTSGKDDDLVELDDLLKKHTINDRMDDDNDYV